MAKNWEYSDAAFNKCGLMICTACRKKIASGQFRYRETDEAYLSQHRECSSDDPQWAKIDAEASKRFEQRRQAAYAAFVAEFGLPNDLIDTH